MSRSASSALSALAPRSGTEQDLMMAPVLSDDRTDLPQRVARSACRLYGLNEKELLCTSHADIFERGLRTHRRRRATALAHGQTLDQLLSTVPDLLFAIDRLVRDLLCGFQPVFPAVIYRPPTKVGGYTRQALPVDDKAVMAIRRALRGRVEATKVWGNTLNELSTFCGKP